MRRTRNAPSEASAQLVRNSSASVSGGAPVPTETSICAGNAAAKYTGHLLNGTISSTASRIELGSHRYGLRRVRRLQHEPDLRAEIVSRGDENWSDGALRGNPPQEGSSIGQHSIHAARILSHLLNHRA